MSYNLCLIPNNFLQNQNYPILILGQLNNFNFENLKIKTNTKKVKKNIPKRLRDLVWNTYNDPNLITGKCFCCKKENIKNTDFICGHIVPESKGGETKLYNLRPICSQCNLSMGSKNMFDFIEKYGFWYENLHPNILNRICNFLNIKENTRKCMIESIKTINLENHEKNKIKVQNLFKKYLETENYNYIDEIISFMKNFESEKSMLLKFLLESLNMKITINFHEEIQKLIFNEKINFEDSIQFFLEKINKLNEFKITIQKLRKIQSCFFIKNGKSKISIIKNLILCMKNDKNRLKKFMHLIHNNHEDDYINFIIYLLPIDYNVDIFLKLFKTNDIFNLIKKISQNENELELFFKILYLKDDIYFSNFIKLILHKLDFDFNRIYIKLFNKEYNEINCTRYSKKIKMINEIIGKIGDNNLDWENFISMV